jgi:hypothetical protein
MRNTLLGALVLGIAAFAASSADAMIGAGEKAPAWEVKDSVNLPATSVDMPSLRGRVLYLDIFRTW